MKKTTPKNCWFYARKMSEYYKVVLEPAQEGTYIFIYLSPQSKFSEKDYLQEDLEDAKRFCELELGLQISGWEEDASIVKVMD